MVDRDELDRLIISVNGRIQELIHARDYKDLDSFGFRLAEAVARDIIVGVMSPSRAVVTHTQGLRTHFFGLNEVTKLKFASDALWALRNLDIPSLPSLVEEVLDFKALAEQQLARSLLRDKSEDNFRSLLQAALAHRHVTRREVPTGRGQVDLLILGPSPTVNQVLETKVWDGPQIHEDGIQELCAYLDTEGLTEGFYVVLDFGEAESWIRANGRGDIWTEIRANNTIEIIFVRIPSSSPSQLGRARRKKAGE